jgi:tRNA-modifying protein YgfZ
MPHGLVLVFLQNSPGHGRIAGIILVLILILIDVCFVDLMIPAEQFESVLAGHVGLVSSRDVITAVGPDTLKFLQGQLSQDVNRLEVGGRSLWTLHLQPNGRVIGFARLTRLAEETVLIDTETGVGESMHAGLARFLIRTKCVLTFEAGVKSLTVLGPPATQVTQQDSGLAQVVTGAPLFDGVEILRFTDASVGPSISVVESPELSETLRIISGIPRHGVEILDATIPSETGLIDAAVTFGKGCYVGQELVERINSRGRTVRSFRRLSTVDIPEASMVEHLMSSGAQLPTTELFDVSGGALVGQITSLTIDPVSGHMVGLGLVRASVEAGNNVAARAAGSEREVLFFLAQ